jgi:hypothetical protein
MSLVIAKEMQAKYTFHTAAVLLYMLYKKFP